MIDRQIHMKIMAHAIALTRLNVVNIYLGFFISTASDEKLVPQTRSHYRQYHDCQISYLIMRQSMKNININNEIEGDK